MVWAADPNVYRYDLGSAQIDVVWRPGVTTPVRAFIRDLHDGWLAWADLTADGARVTRLSGEPVASFAPHERFVQFSPDGRYLLASTLVDGRRVVVGEVPTGKVWFPVEEDVYPWLGWSYGNLAMVLQDRAGEDDTLLGCEVEVRECRRLSHRGRVLLPTS